MYRSALSISVLLLALPFSACGADEPSDEEQIAENAKTWFEAAETGDGATACSLMTASGQEAMTDPYDGIGPDRPPIADTCEEAVAKLAEDGRPEAKITTIRPDDVTIAGEQAVVQPEGGFCTYFQRVDDDWLVAYLPIPGPDDPDASGEIPPCRPAGVS